MIEHEFEFDRAARRVSRLIRELGYDLDEAAAIVAAGYVRSRGDGYNKAVEYLIVEYYDRLPITDDWDGSVCEWLAHYGAPEPDELFCRPDEDHHRLLVDMVKRGYGGWAAVTAFYEAIRPTYEFGHDASRVVKYRPRGNREWETFAPCDAILRSPDWFFGQIA